MSAARRKGLAVCMAINSSLPLAKSSARQFLKTSGAYFAGAALAKLVTFFLLPIYTSLLAPSDYGTFDFWSNLVSFVAPIAFFQVWDATYRFHFDKDHDAAEVVANSFALMAWGLFVYSVAVLPILLASSSAPALLCFFIGLTLCAQYFFGFLARAQMRNALFVTTGILNTATSAATALLMLLVFDQGVGSLYWAMILGNVAQAFVLAFKLRPWRELQLRQISRHMQLRMLRFSLPLCVASAAYWLLAGFARLEILYFVGPAGNGMYAVAMRFAFLLTTLTSVLVYAWNELLYTRGEGDTDRERSSRAPALLLELSLAGASLTVLLVDVFFDTLVDAQYAGARVIVPIVVIATCLNSAATFMASLFLKELRTGWILWTTLWAAALNLGIGTLATKGFGILGATTALVISFGVLLLSRVLLAQRLFGLSLLTRRLVFPTALLGLSTLVFYSGASSTVSVIVMVLVGINVAASLTRERRVTGGSLT